MKTLYDKLVNYSESDFYGFHMPGDKRNQDLVRADLPYRIDITEIDGFDNLHHASGILKDAQIRAAKLYQAETTCFLVNGSTGGILSAILGSTCKGDKVLMARNCHKSVYHAIFLNELHPVYVYPKYDAELELNGEICLSDVEQILMEEPDIKAVILTSPTYDGVLSDVEAIVNAAHTFHIPVILDEAHGAHFGFHSYFPENANTKGVDVVIHSLHKTLPALTQTALIHMNGKLIDRRQIHKYLSMFQTSSPSYVLMSSIDVCIEMLETRGREVFREYTQMLDEVRRKLSGLRFLQLIETEHYDRSKIVISVKNTNYTSKQLYNELLDKYHLQMEMAAGSYILAMTSIGDTREGMDRLVQALCEIDQRIADDPGLQRKEREKNFCKLSSLPKLEVVFTSAEMVHRVDEALVNGEKSMNTRVLPWEKCVGYISTEYVYLYPPGIPIVVPGERFSQEVVDILKRYRELKFSIEGPESENAVEVWING
ncbi:MAG: aminotransferase class I/II-fold pyridoxal phosphate-dependent enzyme [Hespellia sp.]|nr:aminotransferase class I/II-fold pyridoxal phosphate-dependent enzyme [Hespellia sp.]